jgi:sugar lactone lactonase YvrE
MRYLMLLLLMAMIATHTHAQTTPPDKLRVQGANHNPEGLECDVEGERFLLSSLSDGTVYAVDYDGVASLLIEDDELVASVGLELDEANDRLLVVNADMGTLSLAALGIYKASTGERLHMVDLDVLAPQMRHFPNDIALDADGVAYVTDSLAPVIYRVDVDGNASILVEDDRLLIDAFGGNGIVYHPDGYLLVGVSGVVLYKVPLDDPTNITNVETPITIAADGMLWDEAADSLIVVNNGVIVKLTSADDWVSASVAATASRHPATTVAFCGEGVYAIHPKTNEIVRVQFS